MEESSKEVSESVASAAASICEDVARKDEESAQRKAAVSPTVEREIDYSACRPCGEPEVISVFRAIMGIADGHAKNQALSMSELETFLQPTSFRNFSKWILADYFSDRGLRTTKFVQYAQGDGLLQANELRAPVEEYLMTLMVDGGREGGLVLIGSEADRMIKEAERYLKIAEEKRAERRRLKEQEQRYQKTGKRKTKVKDVEVMAAVVMFVSDMPPRNYEVSGSELLTNLQGSPYEMFGKWVTSGNKLRKYGEKGGGTIKIGGLKRAVAEYLGKEMTAIGERQVNCAHQWRNEREHARAQKKAVAEMERARRYEIDDIDEIDEEIGGKMHRRPGSAVTRMRKTMEVDALRSEGLGDGPWEEVGQEDDQDSKNGESTSERALYDALASTPSRAGASLLGEATLPLMCPIGLNTVRVLCFTATSSLSELIFPCVGAKAAHGIEAIQAFVEVRREKYGEANTRN